MAKFFKLLILVPVGLIVLAFSIANRQLVPVSFDPFSNTDASTAFLTAPLFVLLFMALIIGVVIGGIATWFTQGTNRRRARIARDEADRWREEARRMREQPPVMAVSNRSLARSDLA